MVSVPALGPAKPQQVFDLVAVLAGTQVDSPSQLSSLIASLVPNVDQIRRSTKYHPSQATQSISTLAPFGSAATCAQALAQARARPEDLRIDLVNGLEVRQISQKNRCPHHVLCRRASGLKHCGEVLQHLTRFTGCITTTDHGPGLRIQRDLARAIQPTAGQHSLVVRPNRSRSC